MNIQVSKEVKWIGIGAIIILAGILMATQMHIVAIAMLGMIMIITGSGLVVMTGAKLFKEDVFPEEELTEEEQRRRYLRRGY